MAKTSLSEAIARVPTIDRAKLDATTDHDIERYQTEDGYADAQPPAVVREVVPPLQIRVGLGLTQREMADALRVPLGTWRNWEQGRVVIEPAARSLLDIVHKQPAMALAVLKDPFDTAVADAAVSLEPAEAVRTGTVERPAMSYRDSRIPAVSASEYDFVIPGTASLCRQHWATCHRTIGRFPRMPDGMWQAGNTLCFSSVLMFGSIEQSRRVGQTGRVAPSLVPLMLSASKAIIRQHREISAVLATYGLFLGAVLGIAWIVA